MGGTDDMKRKEAELRMLRLTECEMWLGRCTAKEGAQ